MTCCRTNWRGKTIILCFVGISPNRRIFGLDTKRNGISNN